MQGVRKAFAPWRDEMENVVSLTDIANRRRADEKTKANAAAEKKRTETKIRTLAGTLGGSPAAYIVAEVMVDCAEKQKVYRPMPAYCDPANEFRGLKYDATKDLSNREIAQRIRADIKALKLAKGFKISVRSDYRAINIAVMAVPDDFRLLTDKAASWFKQFPGRELPGYYADRFGPDYRALIDALQDIMNAYNRDNSDSMTDYFDKRFYGFVKIDYQLERDLQRREVDASPGNYWAEHA